MGSARWIFIVLNHFFWICLLNLQPQRTNLHNHCGLAISHTSINSSKARETASYPVPQPSQPPLPPRVLKLAHLQATAPHPEQPMRMQQLGSVNSPGVCKPLGVVRRTIYGRIVKPADRFQVMVTHCTAPSPLSTLKVLRTRTSPLTYSALLFIGEDGAVTNQSTTPQCLHVPRMRLANRLTSRYLINARSA